MKIKIYLFFIFILSLTSANFFILKNPNLMNSKIENSLCQISQEHIFGCDSLGRDLFLRSLIGLFNTFLIGSLSLTLAMIVGLLFGFALAIFKNRILNSIFELLNNIPPLIIISLLMLYFRMLELSTGLQMLGFIIALALTHFFIIAKSVESKIKEEVIKDYFLAARAMGLTEFQVYKNHVFPNIVKSFLVISVTQLTTFFLFESTLSFLGVGLQPPLITVGLILQDGWRHFSDYPHLLLGPVFLFSLMLLLVRRIGF